MIGLAIKLLPVWSWLKRNPLLLAIALLALWGVWERHQAHKWQSRAIACQIASDAARKAQEALRAQERAKYQEQARHADQAYAAAIDDARNATDAFIRAHRLRSSGGVSAPGAIGQTDSPAILAPMPADPVVVAAVDVQTCGDLYAYALNAHDWALTITGE
jgi:hypothetical protein